MKKLTIILVAHIYLLVFSGLSLSMHFCGGELNSFSFIGINPNCGCDEEEDDGCCKDHHYYFKDNTEHQHSKTIVNTSPVIVSIVPLFQYYTAELSEKQIDDDGVLSSHPPNQTKYRKHILIGRFTC